MYSRSRKQRDADIDQRILHIHGFIADKLLANPALITQAELTLEARYEQKLLRYGSYLLWHSVLELRGQPEAFRKQLLSDTGILTEEEREEALATFAASEN